MHMHKLLMIHTSYSIVSCSNFNILCCLLIYWIEEFNSFDRIQNKYREYPVITWSWLRIIIDLRSINFQVHGALWWTNYWNITNKVSIIKEWIQLVSSTYARKQWAVGLDTEQMFVKKPKRKVTVMQLCTK